jgi:hypothetical protein
VLGRTALRLGLNNMAPMRAAPRLALVPSCLLVAALLFAGCGADSDSTTASAGNAESRPAPPKSDFPDPEGRSLREVLKAADGPAELVVSPAAQVFYKGRNRYPFGVFQRDRTQVPDAELALYFAKTPTPAAGAKSKSGNKGADAKAEAQALDAPAIGPFPASIESLATQPAFRALTTSEDPDAASVVYSTQIDFPSNGEWRIAALIKQGGEIKGTLLPSAVVGEFSGIPRPGDTAPKIHTPTPEDVGGDLAQITTRIPPDTQNRVDYADALGKEPIVLLFATPQFCQSRVCGPVVDVAEQVKQEYGDQAAFIHMEIWKDNDPGTNQVRPQVRAFGLPDEPWLFTINRQGRISSAVEGAFGPELLTGVVKKVIGE